MAMEAYQWFLLGMMVAWTPGLLALAFMLWRRHIDRNSADTQPHECSTPRPAPSEKLTRDLPAAKPNRLAPAALDSFGQVGPWGAHASCGQDPPRVDRGGVSHRQRVAGRDSCRYLDRSSFFLSRGAVRHRHAPNSAQSMDPVQITQ